MYGLNLLNQHMNLINLEFPRYTGRSLVMINSHFQPAFISKFHPLFFVFTPVLFRVNFAVSIMIFFADYGAKKFARTTLTHLRSTTLLGYSKQFMREFPNRLNVFFDTFEQLDVLKHFHFYHAAVPG